MHITRCDRTRCAHSTHWLLFSQHGRIRRPMGNAEILKTVIAYGVLRVHGIDALYPVLWRALFHATEPQIQELGTCSTAGSNSSSSMATYSLYTLYLKHVVQGRRLYLPSWNVWLSTKRRQGKWWVEPTYDRQSTLDLEIHWTSAHKGETVSNLLTQMLMFPACTVHAGRQLPRLLLVGVSYVTQCDL
jgi:hypothetical protein